jgi:hypothetical protein
MSAETTGPSHRVFADLAEDLTWFIKCPEIRLLHIATTGTERPVVVHQLALTEGHGHNKSPFFILEDAHTKDEQGWMARAERIAVIHDARRTAMASEGYRLPPIPALVHGAEPLAAMAWQLQQCLEAQHGIPELDGLMVVLAPTVLEQPQAFADSVLALVRAPALSNVRYVVIEMGDALAKPFSDALADAAMTSECAVDPAAYRQEMSDALAASAAAPVGASPEVAAGGAGPKDVIAPPRFGKPPRDAAFTPEQEATLAKELGPAVALLGASGALLRQRVAGAALAMQERRFAAAIALQSEAATQCLQAGLVQFACILEVALAAYFLHAEDRARSRATFESAAQRAEAAGLFDVAAQALLGLAAVLVIHGDLEGSTARYARAGELAQKGEMPILAIEAYRTAGQVALRAHAEGPAVIAWKRALTIAEGAPPEALAHSSAPTVARALAKVMQSRGSFDAAQSLLDQADEYERSASPPGAPAERAPVAPAAHSAGGG